MDIEVRSTPGDAHLGALKWQGRTYRCALGRAGISSTKREGDGATPSGRFVLREVYFRDDRLPSPVTGLPTQALDPSDGWCDDPDDRRYNCPVTHPYPASAERLWRDDGLYDVIVVVEHNAAPVRPGAGSAIFLHVASPDYDSTEGCIALRQADLLEILTKCSPTTHIKIL